MLYDRPIIYDIITPKLKKHVVVRTVADACG